MATDSGAVPDISTIAAEREAQNFGDTAVTNPQGLSSVDGDELGSTCQMR